MEEKMLLTNTSEVKGNNLYVAGISIREIANKYGTPLYIYDQQDIENRISEYKRVFKSKHFQTKIAYASKAFLTDYMAKLIKKHELSIDALSIGDMYALEKADFNMENVYLHGNAKSFEEIEYAIVHNVGTIVIDNLQELETIIYLAQKIYKIVNVMIRINPDIYAKTHRHLVTAEKNSKFGISKDSEELISALKVINESKNIVFKGLHCHIGSQVNNSNAFIEEVESMTELAHRIEKDLGMPVLELNLGGGYAIQEFSTQQKPRNDKLLAEIIKFVEEQKRRLSLHLKQVVIEPGRSIVGPGGMTAYRVEATKVTAGDLNYIMVNGGMADNIRPSLYDAIYEAIVVDNVSPKDKMKTTIAGKCCEAGDIIIHETLMPKVDIGDIIVVFSTGAYNYSMASNYNGLEKPAIVFVKDGEHKLVTKRQTVQQIHQNDVNIKVM